MSGKLSVSHHLATPSDVLRLWIERKNVVEIDSNDSNCSLDLSLEPGLVCKRRYEANITCTTYVIPVWYPSQPEAGSGKPLT